MSTKSIDVHVYVQTKATKNSNSDIANAVSNQTGVLKAACNQNVKAMLDIEYDPEQTSGNTILDFVRSKGCTSYLVGM